MSLHELCIFIYIKFIRKCVCPKNLHISYDSTAQWWQQKLFDNPIDVNANPFISLHCTRVLYIFLISLRSAHIKQKPKNLYMIYEYKFISIYISILRFYLLEFPIKEFKEKKHHSLLKPNRKYANKQKKNETNIK